MSDKYKNIINKNVFKLKCMYANFEWNSRKFNI